MPALRTRPVKPQSSLTSAKLTIESGALLISNAVDTTNELLGLARDAIAQSKASNRLEDSAEFAVNKMNSLEELFSRIEELQSKEQTDLIVQQIGIIQTAIETISSITIQYK